MCAPQAKAPGQAYRPLYQKKVLCISLLSVLHPGGVARWELSFRLLLQLVDPEVSSGQQLQKYKTKNKAPDMHIGFWLGDTGTLECGKEYKDNACAIEVSED